MKFTDGYWLMRQGYVPYFAAQAYDIETDSASLTVYAPTRKVNQRGDTPDQPVLTVRYSSPMEGVIRVQVFHHKGGKLPQPQFEIYPQSQPVLQIENQPDAATLTSGGLAVRVQKGDSWGVTFQARGQTLTGSGWRSLGYVDTPGGRFIHEQLNLGVGEYVYGLGERFTPFIKNGQAVDIWNEDGGTSSERAYKNIPFYLTNRGYGVFVNHPEKVSFEVGSEKVERVQFSVPGECLEYFVIYGPTPRQVLERYTALTGRPALPPAWSFGLWLSTSFTTNYDEPTVTGMIEGMAERHIPLSVFHFDCFWMREFNWCDFTWDQRTFPDPAGMLQRLKARGLKICVWINPYIAQRSALFDEAAAAGYLLKRPDGSVWQWDMWQAGMGIVDFTNPAACAWFAEKLRTLQDMGVDAFKTDFGERIPLDVVYHDGSDPARMHNYYTHLYNQTVFNALKERRGAGDAVVFARSATAGGQQYPVHWGGDCTATFESMAESLRGGLSLNLSGFGFWSHDIGGFEHTASAAVYKRWCAFGLLSSHSRLHGSSSYRVPWLYDDEAVDVLRKFTRLKAGLMPYLYQAAIQAHHTGAPMLRAMMFAYPDDPACETLDRQYMLGDSLLVAPVFREDGWVDYYLPAGRWTHFLTDEVVQGGAWRREQVDYLSIPLWVPENTVIPVGAVDERPDYDYAEAVTLHVFHLQDGADLRVSVPDIQGQERAVFNCARRGQTLRITRQGAPGAWSVLLRGVGSTHPIQAQGDVLDM
jgi:alpha-D-xyloside xylohydrolase